MIVQVFWRTVFSGHYVSWRSYTRSDHGDSNRGIITRPSTISTLSCIRAVDDDDAIRLMLNAIVDECIM